MSTTEKKPPSAAAMEAARKLYREWSDHGWGSCHCKSCEREPLPPMQTRIAEALAQAREAGARAAWAVVEAIRPLCDACGEPGVVKYDSNGEGFYWLCARTDGDHDEEHYCGTEVYRIPDRALSPPPAMDAAPFASAWPTDMATQSDIALIPGLQWVIENCSPCSGSGIYQIVKSNGTTGPRHCGKCAPARAKLKELGHG